MQILFAMKCSAILSLLQPGSHLFAVLLYFNPIKLLLLIGWVYLCLYIAQGIQFSSLVPKQNRQLASVGAIFLGPVFVLVLLIRDIRKHISQSEQSTLEIIKGRIQNACQKIRSASFTGSKNDTVIELLDSSGRNIKEIYGHGKNKARINEILDLTKQIIFEALEQEASDILIDPKSDSTYALRFRVDGVLRTIDHFDVETCQAVVNSIKAISNMDIAEKRRPQDGAFVAESLSGSTSFRVASAGVVHGEKLSLRVLNQDVSRFSLDNMGLSAKQYAAITNEISKPTSMILLCGPTGSGKTTTAYAMLNKIDLYTRNVITVEDPVEYVLQYASQIEINPKAGITFPKALRSILRQDPDVICVGEIRDEETAATALRASQTGHLVLATLHCNSNASAIVRLLDLGISALLISSGLNILVSQRLLRKLCDHCKVPAKLTDTQIREFRKKKVNYCNIFAAEGCQYCHGTGYKGRMAVFDMLTLTDNLKTAIANNTSLVDELRKNGDKKGKSNLYKQGLKKVVSGITSLQELKRVVG